MLLKQSFALGALISISLFSHPGFAYAQIGSDAVVQAQTSPADAYRLTAEQNAELAYFGLSPDLSGGKELLKRFRGGCDYNPYAVLEKMKTGGNVELSPKATTGGSLSTGIDPALACRLTKLFEAAKQKGCEVKITSAYRSFEKQANMCGVGRSGCAPAGKSCHQYGLAVDVSAQCVGWLRKVAPEFQLVFPYFGDHIQCLEHPRASCSTSTQPCSGSVKINPDITKLPDPRSVPETYFVPPPGVNPFENPNTPFMAPRPLMPPLQPSAQQAPVSIPSSQPITPQPVPTSQSTQSAPLPNFPSTSTGTSISIPSTSTTTQSSPKPQQATNTPSAIDILSQIAKGTAGQATTSVSVPVVLNPNLQDIVASATPLPQYSSTTGSTGVSVSTQITPSQQTTFGQPSVSPEMHVSSSTFQNQSLYTSALTTIRNALLSIRDFLLYRASVPVPGVPQSWTYPHDHVHE